VFLLEGLGGAWEATEALLTEGGMQWAYSELFQNYSPREVSGYLDHALRQAERVGPLVHYSETHDNERLAKRSAAWSLLRNRLSALSSTCGAFAFTSGVEWLAQEKIDVHQSRGLAWDAEPNLMPELSSLNRLLRDHPCFFDGAEVLRVSAENSSVLALDRHSAEGLDRCLVLVNLDVDSPQTIELEATLWAKLGDPRIELLDQEFPTIQRNGLDSISVQLPPGASYCLAATSAPRGLFGDAYRDRRAQAEWAYRHITQIHAAERLGPCSWIELAKLAAQDPGRFLAALPRLEPSVVSQNLLQAFLDAEAVKTYAPVLRWSAQDLNRVMLVPPGHWVLVEDPAPFEITLQRHEKSPLHLRSTPWDGGHMSAITPGELSHSSPHSEDVELVVDRFTEQGRRASGTLRLLPPMATFEPGAPRGLALLTNGRGGMARLHADLGFVDSKYDCLLGVNLHPDAPCDRHVLAKRLRAWVNADGFITALDGRNLLRFEPGPNARWVFRACAGDGRTIEIGLTASMLPDRNSLVLNFRRASIPALDCRVSLTLRVDIEDRSFHQETLATEESKAHFTQHTHPMEDRPGFAFEPTAERTLRAWTTTGAFHSEPEWSLGLRHTVESSRGMTDHGDAWSPGWFEVPLPPTDSPCLVLCADPTDPSSKEIALASGKHQPRATAPFSGSFAKQLHQASSEFLARRGHGSTVIAGYPWFLDWGRDTLIACRGLLAGGFHAEVKDILLTFAPLEKLGTLPNMLSADSTANRDTSDAPLWFGLACEEAAAVFGPKFYMTETGRRTLREVLASIASGYLAGTSNGIKTDPNSGLVWSPSHFTWMDTNYPAGTPREGYPIEIQALWIRLLRQLERLEPKGSWGGLATLAEKSLELYWCEELGCCHDTLLAPSGIPASQATPDGHLRPNQLFAIALGLIRGNRAQRAVEACSRYLLVPGAIRSLAPLPVQEPLPIHAQDGRLLNDPKHPYCGRYEGDEDTRRKPAYHNGTAWNWLLPVFCEALATAYAFEPATLAAARAYLGSSDRVLHEGCIGHLPEILDGDAPHTARGCDAQAWSVTEALRVWCLLSDKMGNTEPGNQES